MWIEPAFIAIPEYLVRCVCVCVRVCVDDGVGEGEGERVQLKLWREVVVLTTMAT